VTWKNIAGLATGLIVGLGTGAFVAIKGADLLEQYDIFKYEKEDEDDDDDDAEAAAAAAKNKNLKGKDGEDND